MLAHVSAAQRQPLTGQGQQGPIWQLQVQRHAASVVFKQTMVCCMSAVGLSHRPPGYAVTAVR
jgi:hypothetical protein